MACIEVQYVSRLLPTQPCSKEIFSFSVEETQDSRSVQSQKEIISNTGSNKPTPSIHPFGIAIASLPDSFSILEMQVPPWVLWNQR